MHPYIGKVLRFQYNSCLRTVTVADVRQTQAGLPDDVCDLCYASNVSVDRATPCGKTIGIECGCDDSHPDGTCGTTDCEACQERM